MNTNDMRVQKTLENINDVFLMLLKKKRLEKITVNELTQTARISKGTFYRYYRDIYDLYEQTITQNIRRFLDSIDYYDLYFKNHKEFSRRFHIDTENDHLHNRPHMTPEYESFFDQCWLSILYEKILEFNDFEILYGKKPTEKQLMLLHMLLLCDLTAFKRWPEHYDIVSEIISEWNDQFIAGFN